MIFRRRLWPVLLLFAIVLISLTLWWWKSRPQALNQAPGGVRSAEPVRAPIRAADRSNTRIHAHNLLLRKGPNFRVYVRWLDGRLTHTRRDINPSFDQPESFYLDIQTGVIRVNIGDIGQYINSSVASSPLKDVALLADGPNLKLTGVLHKVVPLPVQVMASISVEPDDRVRVHITKINVLKVPLKGLLGLFHVSATDLVKNNIDGVEIVENDLLLDTHKLLPPPHIRGQLTRVSVDSPDIEAVYGNGAENVERVELWRNFFSLDGGSIDFGTLSMHPVKIIIIDISRNPWFDFDLVNYRDQFTSGYTRMTADGGLQIFVPDRREVQLKPTPQNESIQWFKDRNIPPPPQIVASATR